MKIVTMPREKKASSLDFELTTITPTIARQWLDQNTHNRRLKASYVDRLARDIEQGHWRINGEAIKFGDDGTLLDGQHRLAACIKADKPFTSIVVYGLPIETQDVMDSGKSRSVADVLTLNGTKNASNVATAFRFLINERSGRSHVGGVGSVTPAEVMTAMKKHPRLPLYVPTPGAFPRGISVGLVGFVRYAASSFCGGSIDADEMVKVLKTGVPSYDGDAMHKFREKIIHSYAEAVGGFGNRVATINTFKWCWNKFVKQEPVHTLRWATDHVAIERLDLKDL